MKKSSCDKSRILQSIADALGTEPAAFYTGDALPSKALETQQLLDAFDRIRTPEDRRLCLDFINSIVARQEAIAGGS